MTRAELEEITRKAEEKLEADIAVMRADFETFVRGLARWVTPVEAGSAGDLHQNGNGHRVRLTNTTLPAEAPNVAAMVRRLVESVGEKEFTLDDLMVGAERRGCVGARSAFATAMKRLVNEGVATRVREGGPHMPAVYMKARH